MSTASHGALDGATARRLVAQVPRWYHSLDLAPGLTTPGWFDLRPILGKLPWPDVSGRRCLDVGTSNGFFAFELERRGAAEVVATDIGAHEEWDWESHMGDLGPGYLRAVEGDEAGSGFHAAHRILASSVHRERLSVYELSPERLGEFDVVVCGSLLLHLRDPLAALEAIRSVCAGELLLTNQVDFVRSYLRRRAPLFRLDGTSGITQWWLPNAAGNRQLLRASGFTLVRESGVYCVPYGVAHPTPPRRVGALSRTLVRRALAGNDGVAHHAMLAVPTQR